MMRREVVKEERAIVLDFLQYGYPFDKRPMHVKTAIAQALGKSHFILLELVPKKGINLQPGQEVYMGEGKRDEIHHIIGKIPLSKLTQTARMELESLIEAQVKENEEKFVNFFNTAGPINTRRHQIELLPGIGKRHMWEIIKEREEEPFKSFEDLKRRVKLMPDPEKAVVKRILAEMEGEDKHKIFVGT
jgi:putative nucleotide binding protein